MNLPVLTMMVGLPGSGKSYWAEHSGRGEVFSSDKIREELFGTEEHEYTPRENEIVFNALHNMIKDALLNGKDVIYDATNINKRRRISFLKWIKKYVKCHCICVWMTVPYDECIQNNDARDRHVSEEAIYKMYSSFQPPHKTEGWDEIICVTGKTKGDIIDLLVQLKGFDQKNKHHRYDLFTHMMKTCEYVHEYCTRKVTNGNIELLIAAKYHDIGKLRTQSIDKETGEAHYYGHHCAGAYDIATYSGAEINTEFTCEVSNYIYYHMHPYMSWKESTKARRKDKELLGEEMYNNIWLLHEADVSAH